ncbi:MAG: glycosyltransferase [Anaerolineales bacterium]|nr:glycosyltransferase [Anaerolineales bacterium]
MSLTNRPKPRIALVIQRYGLEVSGGAELHARWLAEHLMEIAHIEVITTCALEYTTWENYYPCGVGEINGVKVHRFAVDEVRDWEAAQQKTGRLLLNDHTLFDELAWMQEQGPLSTGLLNFIEQSYDQFDLFMFVTYHYAPTFYGLPLVANKAILLPLAHDDPFLRLPVFRPVFHLPQALVYNTPAERKLVEEIMRLAHHKHRTLDIVAGTGINEITDASAVRFRHSFGIQEPFILYVGRLSASKNVPELFDHFVRYKADYPSELKLVVMGKGEVPVPDHPDILATGFVSEEEKFDGLAAAEFIVVPSKFESLSMLALEAWLMQKPALVNGNCLVLKDQCRRSNGGLYYYNYDEFAAVIDYLRTHPTHREVLGRNGRSFVQQHYSWEVILAKYQSLFEKI